MAGNSARKGRTGLGRKSHKAFVRRWVLGWLTAVSLITGGSPGAQAQLTGDGPNSESIRFDALLLSYTALRDATLATYGPYFENDFPDDEAENFDQACSSLSDLEIALHAIGDQMFPSGHKKWVGIQAEFAHRSEFCTYGWLAMDFYHGLTSELLYVEGETEMAALIEDEIADEIEVWLNKIGTARAQLDKANAALKGWDVASDPNAKMPPAGMIPMAEIHRMTLVDVDGDLETFTIEAFTLPLLKSAVESRAAAFDGYIEELDAFEKRFKEVGGDLPAFIDAGELYTPAYETAVSRVIAQRKAFSEAADALEEATEAIRKGDLGGLDTDGTVSSFKDIQGNVDTLVAEIESFQVELGKRF